MGPKPPLACAWLSERHGWLAGYSCAQAVKAGVGCLVVCGIVLQLGVLVPARRWLAERESGTQMPSNPENGSRVAVCLVGGARAFELTGPTIVKFLLSRAGGVDVFLHAPLDQDAYKLSILSSSSSSCTLVHFRIFAPHLLPLTPASLQLYSPQGSPHGVQGLLQYFSLVEGCLSMIKQHQSQHTFVYDWIIRTRLDGYWNGHLPPLRSMDPTSYTVPNGSHFEGLNDRLGIGNWRTTEIALSRLSRIPLLHAHGLRQLNSERSFKHLLDISNITYTSKDFPFCVLSRRCFGWPLGRQGIPVPSITSKGSLNGAYCRPCTPIVNGSQAMSIIDSLDKSHSWIGNNGPIELCNPNGDWVAGWERLFDIGVEPKFAQLRVAITNQSLAECIEAYGALMEQVHIWEAPSAVSICEKGLRGQ